MGAVGGGIGIWRKGRAAALLGGFVFSQGLSAAGIDSDGGRCPGTATLPGGDLFWLFQQRKTPAQPGNALHQDRVVEVFLHARIVFL
jgi:hypothetical protein